MLCSIFLKIFFFVFPLSLIFSFFLHSSYILSLFIYSFLSLFPLDSLVYSWQKGGEYTGVFRHFMTHMHILRGSNSTSCTFIGVEIHRGDTYIKGEKIFFYEKTFVYLMLVFSVFYGALCSMLYCSHRIMFICWTSIHPHACSNDHLLCYVVIVVISIWLFWYMIKLLICFTSCLLDRNLLVTLYLSFYYLLYHEGLMRFVQVF